MKSFIFCLLLLGSTFAFAGNTMPSIGFVVPAQQRTDPASITVVYDLGDQYQYQGSNVGLYAEIEGSGEIKLVSCDAARVGSSEAKTINWIQYGKTYIFRLYSQCGTYTSGSLLGKGKIRIQ